MNNKFILVLVLFILSFLAEATSTPQELPPRWKKWLDEEVVYIITAKEKEIFLSLTSGREREAFEKAFWLQRDPTPGTPTNEFKDEHFRRLKHANEVLGRREMKPGWKTDRGRIYIILGEPVDIQRFYETAQNLYPCELWQYHGDTSLGLPPFFYILFFQDQGSSEYKLYSPSFDGPQRLVQGSTQAASNRYQAYQQIKELSAELAEASLSFIPGTSEDPTAQTSSLSSDLLITNIQNLPVKKVQSEWAEAFSRNKEIITTDYSVNYIPSDHVLFVHQEGNKNYLHALIEPYRLSMVQYEQKAYAPLKLNAMISDLAGNAIHQEEKSINVEVSLADIEKIQRTLSAITDIIPLVEGNFSVRLLLRNTESKEFSSLEENVASPSSGGPALSPLLFLYNEKAVPQNIQTIPFVIQNHQLYPNAQKAYAPANDLIFYFEIYNPSEELKTCGLSLVISQNEKALATQTEQIGDQTYFLRRFPLKDYKPDYYKLRVAVMDASGKEVFSNESEFNLSSLSRIPRPWSYSKIYPPLDHAYFALIRSYQYLSLGQNDRVIQELEKFYILAAPQKDIATVLATAYFNQNDYPKVIEILDPLKEVQDLEILKLLGKSYFQLDKYERAIEYFGKAQVTGGEIIEVLNLLGYSYYKNNDSQNALRYLERSLKLNPEQPNIRQLIDKLKK